MALDNGGKIWFWLSKVWFQCIWLGCPNRNTLGPKLFESQNQILTPFIYWVKECVCVCQIWGESKKGRVLFGFA